MKKAPKFLLILASLGLLVSCGGGDETTSGPDKTTDENPTSQTDSTSKDDSDTSQGDSTDETYLINVACISGQVSNDRANEIKEGFVNTLPEGTDVSRINFFMTENTSVAAYVDEILWYNEDNPENEVTAILGMNGLSNAGDSREAFESIYQNDGQNYTYGTSSTLDNRTNRKFFYKIDKADDPYVLALQSYLQENWTGGNDPIDPVENTGVLSVGVYAKFVSSEKSEAMKDEFIAYLENKDTQYSSITFVTFSTADEGGTYPAVSDFMADVTEYNTDNPDEKLDTLIGLRADTGKAVSGAGYIRGDSNEYTYSDMSDSLRYFWYLEATENKAMVDLFQEYLIANYTVNEEATKVVLSTSSAQVKQGEYIEVTASTDVAIENPVFTAEADKSYATTEVNGATIKVALSDEAVPEETVIVTVSCGELTPATLTITVVAKEQEVIPETYYTIAFYTRYVSAEEQAKLLGEFADYLKEQEISFDHLESVAYGEFGSNSLNVAGFASEVTSYNDAHDNKIDALLGCKGDSNEALANAGYKQESQKYTYGSDQDRRLWVIDAETESVGTTALRSFLNENYVPVPTKVVLNKTTAELKAGEFVEVVASTDVAVDNPVYEAIADKAYATVEVNNENIKVTLTEAAVAGEEVLVTVSCGELTPATLTITVLATEAVVENNLVVAIYNKYVTSDVVDYIYTEFSRYCASNNIAYDNLYFVGLGDSSTNVAGFATLLSEHNESAGSNTVDLLLGCNGDSNNALANAGYKKLSEENYSYGTDAKRKIWVPTDYSAGSADYYLEDALIAYLNAYFKV